MSHRERLLAAARRCLVTKGYARTTARDLVAESGTNLGSIGYHFGSKDELLNLALVEAQAEYADKVLAVASPVAADADGLARIRAAWGAMVDAYQAHRPLGVAFLEAIVQAERSPELRTSLADSYALMRADIVAALTAGGVGAPGERDALASFFVAVCDGLLVQWLLDPEHTAGGVELFDAAHNLFSGAAPAAAAAATASGRRVRGRP